ncbi:hypothetical protein CEXT_438981 [Caerostris extrusa]|uniref:WAP domain-containing protein n=1 Tax=Caerostris extrusa TaxID=172846 RepID=A0AAV4NVP9_CAEEX|nr:hypothetical protein CEXT_438981 [Caerostris extrusa]
MDKVVTILTPIGIHSNTNQVFFVVLLVGLSSALPRLHFLTLYSPPTTRWIRLGLSKLIILHVLTYWEQDTESPPGILIRIHDRRIVSSCPMMSDEPGVPLPEYRVLSQKLNETGVEMCEDMLHLCPATADCCKKDDGKWDCCPKQAAIGGTIMFFEK